MNMSYELTPAAAQVENCSARIDVLLKKLTYQDSPNSVTVGGHRGESLLVFRSQIL